MKKKKILFLIESMSPESGGPAVEIVRLTELLSENYYLDITIISQTPLVQSLKFSNSIEYVQLKTIKFLSIDFIKNCFLLHKHIKNSNIVFVTGIWGPIDGFALRLVWPKNNIPVYIRTCGMLEPYILKRNPRKKALGLNMYVKSNLHNAKGLIVNSKLEMDNIISTKFSTGKIHIIRNGVKIPNPTINKIKAREHFNLSESTKVLLYLGRLHPKKGLHFLLEALGTIEKKQLDFKLLIAGEFSDGNFKKTIDDLISTYQLEKMIQFTGFANGELKNLHFIASDCFILPSESEGLPNAVLEAMSYGLPAIITSGCNIPEVEEYNAGLVIDLSISNLTKALQWFLNDTVLLQEASKNALKLIQDKFNPDKTAEYYTSFF